MDIVEVRINSHDFNVSNGNHSRFNPLEKVVPLAVATLCVVCERGPSCRIIGPFCILGDSIAAFEDGKQFSTTDQDNDSEHSKDCVRILKGCWWYNKCFGANLNGVYNATEGAMTNIHWPTWYFIPYSSRLKTVIMKIRPVHH